MGTCRRDHELENDDQICADFGHDEERDPASAMWLQTPGIWLADRWIRCRAMTSPILRRSCCPYALGLASLLHQDTAAELSIHALIWKNFPLVSQEGPHISIARAILRNSLTLILKSVLGFPSGGGGLPFGGGRV